MPRWRRWSRRRCGRCVRGAGVRIEVAIGETSTVSYTPVQNGQTIDGLVTGDLTAAGDQGDRQALADPSITALSAPVTIEIASATTPSTTAFAQAKAATPQTTGGDTTAPTVSPHRSPTGATVSGTVTLAATASDNVGVAGVQFLLDNTALGAEDTKLALRRFVEHHHGHQRHAHADRAGPRRRRQHRNLDA